MNQFNFDGVSIDRVLDNNYYDDGWMHLFLNGRCYSFDVGQDQNNRDYNWICNSILRDIGVIGRVSGNNN